MDWLDKLNEKNEEFAEETLVGFPVQERKSPHEVTIIGCIRGVDGWYRAGFDENTKTIVPFELIEKVLISESAQKMQKSELTESEVEE